MGEPLGKTMRRLSLESLGTGRGCGVGPWRPGFLQALHKPAFLLVSLSALAITQGFIVNGIIPVDLGTLERRFSLSSSESGVLASAYDIAVLLVLIPVCHFGNLGHKGRWLGLGMLLFSLGSFLCTLPHFASPPYALSSQGPNGSQAELCVPGSAAEASGDCDGQGSSLKSWYWVLLAGQLIHGVGASPLYTLGNVYLDENVSQRASPLYLGLYMALGALGPALGFIVGGAFIGIYGDVGKVDMGPVNAELPKGADDERWYGAWWLGFIVSGSLSFLLALPMLCFDRQLPGAAKQRAKDVDQANRSSAALTDQAALSHKARDLPKAIWALFRNGTFMAALGMQTAEAFLLNGFINFVPKLMKEVYLLSDSAAAFVCGVVVIPGVFIGNVSGGAIMRRLGLKVKGALVLAILTQFLSLALYFGFLAVCPQPSFAGIHSAYLDPDASLDSVNLTATCNLQCGSCLEHGYQPVCEEASSQSFFNPCFAGCTQGGESVGKGEEKKWSSCACVGTEGGRLREGVCSEAGSCSWQYPTFLAFFAVATLVTFVAAMPVQQVTMRCVEFSRRSLSLGLTWVFIRLLGSIPGPVLIGAAIDKACLLWETKCDGARHCLSYDSPKIAWAILGFALAAKLLNILFLSLGLYFYTPPPQEPKELPGSSRTSTVHPELPSPTGQSHPTMRF